MEKTIEDLIKAAHNYKMADTELENICQDQLDPIACTVFAYTNKHLETLPLQAITAGAYLAEVTKLHGVLVTKYGMDCDVVRSLWFDILNT